MFSKRSSTVTDISTKPLLAYIACCLNYIVILEIFGPKYSFTRFYCYYNFGSSFRSKFLLLFHKLPLCVFFFQSKVCVFDTDYMPLNPSFVVKEKKNLFV